MRGSGEAPCRAAKGRRRNRFLRFDFRPLGIIHVAPALVIMKEVKRKIRRRANGIGRVMKLEESPPTLPAEKVPDALEDGRSIF